MELNRSKTFGTRFSRISFITVLAAAMALAACGGTETTTGGSGGGGGGGADTVRPTATITSPTTAGSYSTSSITIDLAGTATDNVGVTEVSWTSNSDQGIAIGTSNWSITGISLQPGSNTITVTAKDAAGNKQVDTLTVTYNQVAFMVEVTWPANTDNPDGYNVYVGPTVDTVDTLATTLVAGSPEWDPLSPFAQIPSPTVLAAVGASSQVCVRIRAYNGVGLSGASEATCQSLPI